MKNDDHSWGWIDNEWEAKWVHEDSHATRHAIQRQPGESRQEFMDRAVALFHATAAEMLPDWAPVT